VLDDPRILNKKVWRKMAPVSGFMRLLWWAQKMSANTKIKRDHILAAHEAERFPMKSKVMSINRFNSAVKGFVLTLAPALFLTMLVAGHPVPAAAESRVQQLLDAQARQRQELNDAMNKLKEAVIENSSNPDELRSIYDKAETSDPIQDELDNQLQAIGDIAERERHAAREAEQNRDRQPDSSSEGSAGCTNSDGSTIPGSENWSACPAN
jgi:hypothetical protein